MRAAGDGVDLARVFVWAGGWEVGVDVGDGWVGVAGVADGAGLVVGRGVGEGVDLEGESVVGEEVGDLEGGDGVWHDGCWLCGCGR